MRIAPIYIGLFTLDRKPAWAKLPNAPDTASLL